MDFKESDKIVTFFTRNHGKLRGIAKGAKRSKRRFGSNLESFSHVLLRFFEKENLDLVRVESCEFIQDFSGIRTELRRILHGSYFLELVERMTAEKEAHQGLFSLLVDFLGFLDRGEMFAGMARIFEVRALSYLGYLPSLERCTACSRAFGSGQKLAFHPERGGAFCPRCRKGLSGAIPVSLGTLKILSLGRQIDLGKLKRLVFSEEALKESEQILRPFIRCRLTQELKSLKFLERMGWEGDIKTPGRKERRQH